MFTYIHQHLVPTSLSPVFSMERRVMTSIRWRWLILATNWILSSALQATRTHLDFVPGSASLMKYNCQKEIQQLKQMAVNVQDVKPYSNLCGLAAFGKEWNSEDGLKQIQEAVGRAARKSSPS